MERLGDTIDTRTERYKANLRALRQALLNGTALQASKLWSRAHVLDLVMDQSQSFHHVYPTMLHLRTNP